MTISVQPSSIERNGDTWALAWDHHGVAMGMDRLHESRDELRAEVTVESRVAGRVLGPVRFNILSSESQSRFATACEARVNGLEKKLWHGLIVQACAVVAKQYRAPTPVLNLAEVDTSVEVEYLVPGLIPADETTVIYGDGESAKSLTALRIAVSVAQKQMLPWEDYPTARHPVLYLDWETNPRTVAGRLRRITDGMQISIPEIHYRQCFRSLADELPNIKEEIAKRSIGLVIVDSIGFAASGALVEDETARASMNALRQMSPATRLVVAHISADAARNPSGAARPFGSAFFWNGMRSGLELRRSEEGGGADEIKLGLYHRKANDGEHHKPIGLDVMFDGRSGPIQFWTAQVFDTPDLAARTPLSARLRRILQGGAQSTDDLSLELEESSDNIGRTLRRMSDVRRVDAGGRGSKAMWGLAE